MSGPDLSHLTEEERSIILAVVERQQREEEKEQSLLRGQQEATPPLWSRLSGLSQLVSEVLQVKGHAEAKAQTKLHQQFEQCKEQVRQLGAVPAAAGAESAAVGAEPASSTCSVCSRTKFADGCGRICCYCQGRFCGRCGGRVSQVMWVCNVCRKKQDILTQSDHRPPPPAEGAHPGGPQVPLSNGAAERKSSPVGACHHGGRGRMLRSPSDLGEGAELQGRRWPIRDQRGRWHSQDPLLDQDHLLDPDHPLAWEEEEVRAWYRSEPNLARYPVKAPPSDETMRVLAQVGQVRHQRRHSDVSLAATHHHHHQLTPQQQALCQSRPQGWVPSRGQRSLSVDRVGGPSSSPLRHSGPTHLRTPAYESAAQRRAVIGSFSSSEEELGSWEEQQRDMELQWWDQSLWPGEAPPLSMQPATWQPSKDGERLIGRILLNKRMKDGTIPADTGALLGLKVVGGKMTEAGRLCAFITKVKRGSLADTVGHLRPGDQVLEWNGRVLQGATFNQVYNIILESKAEPQVELLVSRLLRDGPRVSGGTPGQINSSSSSLESQKGGPTICVSSPISPCNMAGQLSSESRRPLVPRIQIRLFYDRLGHQLIVTVLGAKDLPGGEDLRPRNPYVKIYFLPDRSDKSKRRTKTVKKSVEPRWNQTFMYSPVHQREFRERTLELTVWDQARVREEESQFLGQVLVDLDSALLDDQPHWYKLQLPDGSPYLHRRDLQPEETLSSRRLQRSQRISDGEFSDYDCEEGIGVIPDYRHNGRDFHSSTLSVPDQVMSSNHSSRSDMARMRSRSPSQPPQQRSSTRGGSAHSSPSTTPVFGRRVRQLPLVPPTGPPDRVLAPPTPQAPAHANRLASPHAFNHQTPPLIRVQAPPPGLAAAPPNAPLTPPPRLAVTPPPPVVVTLPPAAVAPPPAAVAPPPPVPAPIQLPVVAPQVLPPPIVPPPTAVPAPPPAVAPPPATVAQPPTNLAPHPAIVAPPPAAVAPPPAVVSALPTADVAPPSPVAPPQVAVAPPPTAAPPSPAAPPQTPGVYCSIHQQPADGHSCQSFTHSLIPVFIFVTLLMTSSR
ncbi:regulating synaptic membrane exocytosis protein 2 isoform X2 [Nelusetta ayraudi]|uniref:regulating synaptic membrane exocytosis protein 2 isoform X2 n=1 Tax=Nelusetta ayraudi TaxID=303726 RepID=UPI003F702939